MTPKPTSPKAKRKPKAKPIPGKAPGGADIAPDTRAGAGLGNIRDSIDAIDAVKDTKPGS